MTGRAEPPARHSRFAVHRAPGPLALSLVLAVLLAPVPAAGQPPPPPKDPVEWRDLTGGVYEWVPCGWALDGYWHTPLPYPGPYGLVFDSVGHKGVGAPMAPDPPFAVLLPSQ